MSKYYLVKSTSIPTELQVKETGNRLTETAFYGKGCEMLALVGKYAKKHYASSYTCKYLIREYGYKRKCDASRAWGLNNTLDNDYWKYINTIIEVNV